jgi:hypothetical protein
VREFRRKRTNAFRHHGIQMQEYWVNLEVCLESKKIAFNFVCWELLCSIIKQTHWCFFFQNAWERERTKLILSQAASALDVVLAEETFYEQFSGGEPSLEVENEISVASSEFTAAYLSFLKEHHKSAMTFLGFGKYI